MLDKPKFKNGEWVIIVDHDLEGFGGFITKHDWTDNSYFVEVTSKPSGGAAKYHIWVDEEQLISDEEIDLDEIQISNLLDIALDTKDHGWFKELSELLKLSTSC